jgi:(p)ppGpp synthase/HD superfamily hydrolase
MTGSKQPLLTKRFEKALQYAAQLHAAQTRKGSRTPYISHLMAVTTLVLEDGGSEDEAIAALLHDAVEDQGGMSTLEEIRARFGDNITDIVLACSDAFTKPKPPWQERKEAHIEHMRQARPEARRVILADKLHNARSVLRDLRLEGDTTWKKFTGGKDGTLWYYRAAFDVLTDGKGSYLAEELERVLAQIEKIANK